MAQVRKTIHQYERSDEDVRKILIESCGLAPHAEVRFKIINVGGDGPFVPKLEGVEVSCQVSVEGIEG